MGASPRIVYVNGRYCPIEEATIPIMDRGFLFADGIYEVSAVLDGKLIDNRPHLERLDRSLGEIKIRNPHTIAEWTAIQRELIDRNQLDEGLVYIEVTRGVYEREFTCPPEIEPTVVMFTQAKPFRDNPLAKTGAAVITVPDIRWERRDIKSVALLAQVLAKQAAKAAGVAEAWMVQDGVVTEGASSTAFIVSKSGEIVTRALSNAILPGVTRRTIIRLAETLQMKVAERAFSIDEALNASEAFITSASSIALPITTVDGKPVGTGAVGPVVTKLRELYFEEVAKEAE